MKDTWHVAYWQDFGIDPVFNGYLRDDEDTTNINSVLRIGPNLERFLAREKVTGKWYVLSVADNEPLDGPYDTPEVAYVAGRML
jgi:hypothetical protein